MIQPEEHACRTIDQLLIAAGWQVCDPQDAHITAHRCIATGTDIKVVEVVMFIRHANDALIPATLERVFSGVE